MRTTRATAVVIAGAALALPAAAEARPDGPPARVLLRAPLSHEASLVAHKRAFRAHRLRGRAVHLARKLDRAHGRKVRVRDVRKRVHKAAVPALRHRVHTLHVKLVAARAPEPAPVTAMPAATAATPAATAPVATPAPATTAAPSGAASATLEAIAACESGGNPSTNTGNGFYGKYQFTQETWSAVGGTGSPAAASEAEQDARAAQLYAQQGSAPWPECGR